MPNFDECMNPAAFGKKECPHCNGYGSSLKDPEGVDRCTQCGGSGLVLIDSTNIPSKGV
jgi:DnaJ-class molecular chaperone